MESLHALVVGEALWDLRAPRGKAFVDAPSLALDAGGGAVRAAFALRAAGADVELAAVFGDDALGAALRERVARGGIGVGACVSSKAARTGLVAMDIDREGARRVVAYRSKDEPAPPWPAWDAARPFDLVLASGVTPKWKFGAPAATAREAGALVVVDLDARRAVFRGRAATHACLGIVSHAHVVKASADDLAAVGLDEGWLLARMSRGALLVRTDGAKPARLSLRGAAARVASATVPVPKPLARVDPTGAGDAFTAALALALRPPGPLSPITLAAAARAVEDAHAAARAAISPKSAP